MPHDDPWDTGWSLAHLTWQLLGGHQRLDAGQERRSKVGQHGDPGSVIAFSVGLQLRVNKDKRKGQGSFASALPSSRVRLPETSALRARGR